MEVKIFSILHVLVAFQSALTTIYLLFQRRTKLSNYFLAASFLLLSIHFSYNFLIENEIYVDILIRLSCVYGFAYGPLMFLYIRSLLYRDFQFDKKQWLHLLPFGIATLSTLLGFGFCHYFTMGIFISMIGYSLSSIWMWFNYRQILRKTTTHPDPHLYNWVRAFVFFMLLIVFTDILQFLFTELSIGNQYISLDHVTQSLLLVLVLMVQYQNFFSPELFRSISENDSNLLKKLSFKNSDLDGANFTQSDLEEIKHFLSKEKLFLKPQLTIQDLANKMDWSARKLSRVINIYSGTNFSDYINKMRLDEACSRLKNPIDVNETISEVMYDCGFNSRSVFNSSFKSHTGYTPSVYKKRNLQKT